MRTRPNIKGVRAEAAMIAYPEKSNREIAEELGISYLTVLRARNKRAGKNGHNGNSHRPLDKAAQAIERRLHAGEPLGREAIVEEAGVSRGIADTALAIHRATDHPSPEPIDPSTLSLSAQAKLDIATRQMAHTLRMEHATRMARVDEEVRQRVLAATEARLARLNAMEAKAAETEAQYQKWTDRLVPTLTEAEFFVVLRALDPAIEHQLAKPNPERIKLMNDAAALLNDRRDRLTFKKVR
jgi:hypothetical protein